MSLPKVAQSRTYPIGAQINLAAFQADPYPIYEDLQQLEPISWIPALKMWMVTRYADVRAILLDAEHFTTASEHSLIFDTFGAQMLTTETSEHTRYRRPVQHAFQSVFLRERHEAAIRDAAAQLLSPIRLKGKMEVRFAIARRLPILVILGLFGLSPDAEGRVRDWYDSFEKALANFGWNAVVREIAGRNVIEFHSFLDQAMAVARRNPDGSLLSTLVNAPGNSLADDEIRRNLAIIFFGGISTVEALILNSLWALFNHADLLQRVRADLALVPKIIEETMRWMSPVQSATRHVVRDHCYQGVQLEAGTIVNCMLAAANRDPLMFAEPARFNIDRPNLRQHLGFASGIHSCLGLHLARMEVRIVLELLLSELRELHLVADPRTVPYGCEFRQPHWMEVVWTP